MSKAKKEANIPNPEVGKRLREAIQSKGFTQTQVARKLDYSNNAISNLIHGYNRLTPELAERLADLLDVSAEYLLCESKYPTKHTKGLFKDINEMNIKTGYYNQFFSSDIIIVYDDEKEVFRLTSKKSKEIRYATKDQLDDYCKYFKAQTISLQRFMWDILEDQTNDKEPRKRVSIKREYYTDPQTGQKCVREYVDGELQEKEPQNNTTKKKRGKGGDAND